MEKPIVFTRKASGMVRELGMLDVMAFLMAIVFGAGILMFAPQGAVIFPGSSIPLAYLVIGIVMLPFVITIGYMMTALPRTGGLYVTIARSLHPTIGYMAGWLFFVAMGLIAGLICFVAFIVGEAAFARIGITVPHMATLWISLVLIFIFWGINRLGIRVVRNVTRVIVVIPLAVLLGIAIYMLTLGPNGGIATYDAIYGAGAMAGIRAAAGSAGWGFPVFSMAATASAFAAVIFAYGGAEGIAALSGEMRTNFRTIFWGLTGGFLVIMVLYLLTSNAAFSAFGENVAAYTFLANNDPEALGAIVPVIGPSVPYFMLSVIKSNGLAFTLGIAIMLWPLNSGLMLFSVASRLMFSFSFDRNMPEVFSKVNRRGAPTHAANLTLIAAICGLLIIFYGVGSFLGIVNMCLFQLYWLFGLAVMALPAVRPDIAERAPCGKWVLFGLGLYTFLMGWFFTGLAAKTLDLKMIYAFVFILFVGFIFYIYQQNINRKKGIDISEIYRQIPPE